LGGAAALLRLRFRRASCFAPRSCAQSCEAHSAKQDGGARRDRTDDLMLAKHALYQLSYGPSFAPARPELRRAGPPLSEAFFPCGVAGVGRASSSEAPRARRTMVGPGRLELPTSRLSGVRSNQLSYGPSGSALKPAQTIDLGLAIAPRATDSRPGGDQEERETKTAATCTCLVCSMTTK
jgi:hypothetical protein